MADGNLHELHRNLNSTVTNDRMMENKNAGRLPLAQTSRCMTLNLMCQVCLNGSHLKFLRLAGDIYLA